MQQFLYRTDEVDDDMDPLDRGLVKAPHQSKEPLNWCRPVCTTSVSSVNRRSTSTVSRITSEKASPTPLAGLRTCLTAAMKISPKTTMTLMTRSDHVR